jgi:phosphoribosylformylglycinamidine synthase
VRLQQLVLGLARRQLLSSAHDVSDGGLLVAIAECCIASGVGCRLQLGISGGRDLGKLFSEEPSRIVISYAAQHEATLRSESAAANVPFHVLGETGGDTLDVEGLASVSVAALAEAHAKALDVAVGDAA